MLPMLDVLAHVQAMLTDTKFIHGYFLGLGIGLVLGAALIAILLVWAAQE